MFIPKLDEEVNSFLGIDGHSSTPERRLLAALLERAILDFVGNETAEVRAAEEWLFDWENEDCGKDAPLKDFSFRWVCHYLDLNPTKVAGFIKAMPKRGSRRIAPWYFSRREEWGQAEYASVR